MGRRGTDPSLTNCMVCGADIKRRDKGRKYCSRACAGNTKHGMTDTPEFWAWYSMYRRCYNPKHISYRYYGGRGITICDRWLNKDGFANFYADMGPRPHKDMSPDRINNKGNYEPENCRWATKKEQAQNRRRSWKPEEDAILRQMLAEGASYSEVTKVVGRPAAPRAHRLGLKSKFDPHAPRGPRRLAA
jgi:hypothetical protein